VVVTGGVDFGARGLRVRVGRGGVGVLVGNGTRGAVVVVTGGLDFGARGLRVLVGRGPKVGLGSDGTGADDNLVG
jgi:hypothetical protein